MPLCCAGCVNNAHPNKQAKFKEEIMNNLTDSDYQIPENEWVTRTTDNVEVAICPNCGAINHINQNWYGSIRGLIFCWKCGKEL